MIFCERWYYIQVRYKGDNELLSYQPCDYDYDVALLGTLAHDIVVVIRPVI